MAGIRTGAEFTSSGYVSAASDEDGVSDVLACDRRYSVDRSSVSDAAVLACGYLSG